MGIRTSFLGEKLNFLCCVRISGNSGFKHSNNLQFALSGLKGGFMKALIAAGGRGTRLRPITFTNNKHLIPIANKPMILYPLEAIKEAGISEVGVVVNETRTDVEALLGDGSRFGVEISYLFQPGAPGIADCVRRAKKFLGKKPFVFYLGDNILAGGIRRFMDRFLKEKPNAILILSKVPDPERFGVAVIKRGRVVKTVEKPKEHISDLAITGIYFFDYHVFEAFEGKEIVRPSVRGEMEIPDVYQYLIDHDYQVIACEVTGWWKDTGKMKDLLDANRLVLDRFNGVEIKGRIDESSEVMGDVKVGKDSQIINSVLRGPVVIGQKVLIKNSYIGPYTSIYHRCQVVNSELENSILLEGAQLLDLDRRVDRSLIGKDARVIKTDTKPRAYNFLIGDTCQVDLV
jgi:glucose-1-phosphate thymidylyltransferase